MLKSGNGKPEQCIANLVSMTRGECPYDRVKGLNPEFIGMNSGVAKAQIKSDVLWLIRTYEPRASADDVNLEEVIAGSGMFKLNIETTVSGGNEQEWR